MLTADGGVLDYLHRDLHDLYEKTVLSLSSVSRRFCFCLFVDPGASVRRSINTRVFFLVRKQCCWMCTSWYGGIVGWFYTREKKPLLAGGSFSLQVVARLVVRTHFCSYSVG